MLEKELSFADLSISLSELYEAMGYADAVPDEAVEKEVRGVLGRVEAVTSPRFCFFISGGDLDETKDLLTVGKTSFSIGKIITRQLRGSESFAFFAATAGTGFEKFQHTLQQEGDMVKVYIADAIGSIIAEKTADCMEIALDEYIHDRGWRHTNRFSPGYCGWHVSEQKKLFPLFPSAVIFFSCHYNFPAFFLQSFFNFSGDLKIDILFFCLIHTDLSRIIPAVPAVKNDYLIFRCYISAGYKFLQILTEQHKYRQKK